MKEHTGFYLDLIRNVFQAVDDEGKLRNRVVAFTSATSGEGVSYVVSTIARELATMTKRRVLEVDALSLQRVRITDPAHVSRICAETQIDNLLTLSVDEADAGLVPARNTGLSTWSSDPGYRNACLKALRWNFDYILVDCPSLQVSADAAMLASIVDGTVVVVEAGRTRRGQIQRAKQILEGAGGNFLGFVLNRRRFPLPGWLYQRL